MSKAIGPYSPYVIHGDLVYTSGQIAMNQPDLEAETKQVLSKLESVLNEAGSEKNKVIKTTIFLSNMDDFETVNGIYADFFGEHRPARSTVQVAHLPKELRIEIECIAHL